MKKRNRGRISISVLMYTNANGKCIKSYNEWVVGFKWDKNTPDFIKYFIENYDVGYILQTDHKYSENLMLF